MLSDEDIIKGCLKGKRASQRLLYDKYAPVMYGVCQRYFASDDQAEDAMQEGFIKVFSHLADFRGDGSFEGWIRRIMVTTSLNYFRDNKRYYYQLEYEDVTELSEETYFQEDQFTRTELLNTLRNMPDGYRTVFNMYEIEGFNHKEIADMLGVSVNTSKSQLAKARKMLQKRLLELYQANPLHER